MPWGIVVPTDNIVEVPGKGGAKAEPIETEEADAAGEGDAAAVAEGGAEAEPCSDSHHLTQRSDEVLLFPLPL